MAASVTEIQIINGLMRDPRFIDWTDLSMVTRHLARLPEIVGAARMAEKVTFKGIMQLHADLLNAVLAEDFSPDDSTGYIRKQLSGIRNGLTRAVDVYGPLYDRYEPIETPNSFRFLPAVRERYLEGRLTYADLLRMQPGVFVITYHPPAEKLSGDPMH